MRPLGWEGVTVAGEWNTIVEEIDGLMLVARSEVSVQGTTHCVGQARAASSLSYRIEGEAKEAPRGSPREWLELRPRHGAAVSCVGSAILVGGRSRASASQRSSIQASAILANRGHIR